MASERRGAGIEGIEVSSLMVGLKQLVDNDLFEEESGALSSQPFLEVVDPLFSPFCGEGWRQ